MRRLARAHPEAVAIVSPAAVEDSRTKYAAVVSPGKVSTMAKSRDEPRKWRNADFSTPEFFEWLNTMPADVSQRLAEDEDEEEQGDESEEEKLNGCVSFGKTFLVPRAKISPYDLGIYPPGLLQARDEVLQPRSQAQLRLAHDRLKAMEAGLHVKAGNYYTAAVGFEEPAPPAGGPTANDASSRHRHPRSRAPAGNTRVVYGPSETFAYVYHGMIPAYTVVHRVMTELRNELPDLNPRSILDFGSGPGTAALAVWDVWGREGGEMVDEDGNEIWEEGSRLSEVRLVEESQSMKDACKVMLQHLAEDGRVRVGYGSSLLEEARAAGREDGGRGSKGGKKFDLVVAAYSLSDLSTHASSRAAATAVLWSLVAPGGALVVVEDGSLKGSHTVRSAREMVLRPMSPLSQEGGEKRAFDMKKRRGGKDEPKKSEETRAPYVVGPCRHDKACPLQTGESCSFSQKVPWNAVHVGKSSVRSGSFSYVSIRKGPPVRLALPVHGLFARSSSSSVDLLKAFVRQQRNGGGLSEAMDSLGTDGISDGTLRREDWARLVRKPLKAKGHALLDVCSPDGTIQRKIVAKGKWRGVPGVFVAARKSELGGLWPYLDNHDMRDRTASRRTDDDRGHRGRGSQEDSEGDLPEEEEDWEGWEEVDEDWETMIDAGQGRVGRSGERKQQAARRRRRRDRSGEFEADEGL
ncbi:unnamed protein product [Ascophyllum nodosum]